jgi:hypothetical protein
VFDKKQVFKIALGYPGRAEGLTNQMYMSSVNLFVYRRGGGGGGVRWNWASIGYIWARLPGDTCQHTCVYVYLNLNKQPAGWGRPFSQPEEFGPRATSSGHGLTLSQYVRKPTSIFNTYEYNQISVKNKIHLANLQSSFISYLVDCISMHRCQRAHYCC